MRCRSPIALGLAVVSLLCADTVGGQTTMDLWEKARRQPIVDGQGAAGIRLGDTRDTVTRKLGQAARIDASNSVATMDHLYQYAALDESWLIAMNLAIGPRGVDVIHVTAVRRGKTPFPYFGRTRKGYAPGEDVERLQALYGAPTEVFTLPPGGPRWFWYRSAGLIVSPPIEGEASYEATQFTVVPPNITAGEARHLLFR